MITLAPDMASFERPAQWDAEMIAFLEWMQALPPELNALVPFLASAAGPSGIFVTYTFDGASASVADPGAGKLRLNNLTQGGATAALADNVDSLGVSATGRLARLTSTSDLEGNILAYKVGDPTKWLMGGVSANTAASGYYNMTLTDVEVSTANPFADGDSLVMIIMPKGDKGDKGDTGATPDIGPHLIVRDEKTAGSSGGSASTGANTRTLNTTVRNVISGASLAANQITLPAGTYHVEARAPAFGVGANQLYLYNVTDSTVAAIGEAANAVDIGAQGYYTGSLACLAGKFTIAASKVFELRHYCTATGAGSVALGSSVGSGLATVFAVVEVWVR